MLEPRNELGVIVVFAQEGPRHGFQIKDIQSAFPDALIEKEGITYKAEFEFMASAFDAHGHDHRGCDLIICWENDCTYTVLPILALSEQRWMDADLDMPTDAEKAAHYWQIRAYKAERALKTERGLTKDRKKAARGNSSYHWKCPRNDCDFVATSRHQRAGHGNAHRTKGERT